MGWRLWCSRGQHLGQASKALPVHELVKLGCTRNRHGAAAVVGIISHLPCNMRQGPVPRRGAAPASPYGYNGFKVGRRGLVALLLAPNKALAAIVAGHPLLLALKSSKIASVIAVAMASKSNPSALSRGSAQENCHVASSEFKWRRNPCRCIQPATIKSAFISSCNY